MKKDKQFIDDCPICAVVDEADKDERDINLTDLKEAFRKAKKQGAIVFDEFND